MQIVVLGAGLVGSAIAKDLAREADFDVTAVDLNRGALERLATEARVETIQANLQTDPLVNLIVDCDLVVCAVPGFMGFETLKGIIQASKNVVDISFFAEDAFLLDDLAKANDVTAVVDCGVAPGLCNILAGRVAAHLDRVERYLCYVGGLPQVRQWPYEYKAVFSPVDVLEEYTRPARFIEYGQEVVRPALSDVELRDFPGVGTLEAFNTDGLRSLIKTLDAPFKKEKTLRYPGHAELMRIFRESGFFDKTPIEVDGHPVSPLDLVSRLLFEQWKLKEGERDLTVLQVTLDGYADGRRICYTYDMVDRYDPESHTTSMARTTGYTCAIVARQVARGLFAQKGVCPPEYVGQREDCYTDLLSEYAKRNIVLEETITEYG
jgi:saccharopine dehydrogenase-like NADP-dependent oxidoreductase